jgi:GTPase
MKKARDTKRSRRLGNAVPSVAIVGYTNAGKSSLLNALTDAGVLVEDALFATLDPTTRRAELPDGREYVLTDTVGFVRHLPTQLVEAFRSTLEEVTDADLLVHVVDGSDPLPAEQIQAVREVITQVLRETNAPAPQELLVVNKIDAADHVTLTQLRGMLPGAVFISAHTGEGIDELRARLADILGRLDIEVSVLLPFNRGDLVARIHADGRILRSTHDVDGTRVHARVPKSLASALHEYAHGG